MMSDFVENLVRLFVVTVFTIAGLFSLVIFNTLIGAVAGWVVGLVFGDTILGILAQLGVKNITMFQFGAFMGFVGGFLKTKVSKKAA